MTLLDAAPITINFILFALLCYLFVDSLCHREVR